MKHRGPSTNRSKYRQKLAVIILITILFIVILCQVQPVIVSILGGVDGSFGLRPKTHGCIGFSLEPNSNIIKILPQGDLRFKFIRFSFIYRLIDPDSSREYCLGQDIWFGE